MKRVSLAVVLALALSPTPAFAQTTPTYGESQIGKTGCVPNNNDADFDTIAQCDASSGTGTFQKAPLFIGAVSSPPYASTSCSSSMAGMIQYTGSVFEGCNGTAWSQFESSSGTLTFPVGSVSAPGLAVTTDTSTGLFQATTGTISFATEGVEALRLLNTTSAVDYLTVQPGITGSPGTVTVGAGGSDSNINIALTPKGSGGVNVTSGAVDSDVRRSHLYFQWRGDKRRRAFRAGLLSVSREHPSSRLEQRRRLRYRPHYTCQRHRRHWHWNGCHLQTDRQL